MLTFFTDFHRVIKYRIEFIAKVIVKIIEKLHQNRIISSYNAITFIGYCMGGHLLALAGRKIQVLRDNINHVKPGYLIGITLIFGYIILYKAHVFVVLVFEPASFGFNSDKTIDVKLRHDDADVIYSMITTKKNGFFKPNSLEPHARFFVNDGKQPECKWLSTECNHLAGQMYLYAMAHNHVAFIGKNETGETEFGLNKPKIVASGEYTIKRINGGYLAKNLVTNDDIEMRQCDEKAKLCFRGQIIIDMLLQNNKLNQ